MALPDYNLEDIEEVFLVAHESHKSSESFPLSSLLIQYYSAHQAWNWLESYTVIIILRGDKITEVSEASSASTRVVWDLSNVGSSLSTSWVSIRIWNKEWDHYITGMAIFYFTLQPVSTCKFHLLGWDDCAAFKYSFLHLPLDLFLRFDFPPVRSILRLFRNMAVLV